MCNIRGIVSCMIEFVQANGKTGNAKYDNGRITSKKYVSSCVVFSVDNPNDLTLVNVDVL